MAFLQRSASSYTKEPTTRQTTTGCSFDTNIHSDGSREKERARQTDLIGTRLFCERNICHGRHVSAGGHFVPADLRDRLEEKRREEKRREEKRRLLRKEKQSKNKLASERVRLTRWDGRTSKQTRVEKTVLYSHRNKLNTERARA